MIFDGIRWRRTRTVITLPELHEGVYLQFARICKEGARGAVATDWNRKRDGRKFTLFAKPIPHTGWGRTDQMYAKDEVRCGEVYVRAYIQRNGRIYTASWVHKHKTIEYQVKKCQERLDKSNT
jgi:hypothetical protein